MNVLRAGNGFVVDSRFRLDEYDTPSTSEDVLNLQVWAQNREFAVELGKAGNQVLGRGRFADSTLAIDRDDLRFRCRRRCRQRTRIDLHLRRLVRRCRLRVRHSLLLQSRIIFRQSASSNAVR